MKKTDIELKFIQQFQNYYQLKIDKKQHGDDLNYLIKHSARYQILPKELVEAGIYYHRVNSYYRKEKLASPTNTSQKNHIRYLTE